MASPESEDSAPSRKSPPLMPKRLFSGLSLRTKLNLAMLAIFILAVVSIYILAGHLMQHSAKQQVFAKSRLLLTTIASSRHFSSKVIKPSLYEVIPFKYIIEGMSSASGQQSIFDTFRAIYPSYYFKLAVPKPRNPVNEPNAFEREIIDEFRRDPGLAEWRGYTEIDGKPYFMVMAPIVADETCLRCHSTPQAAPAELNRRYASWYGFGLNKPGDIYGLLSVSVPAPVVAAEAKQNTLIFIGMVTCFFVLLSLIFNLLFQRVVLGPIRLLSKNAIAISIGNLSTRIDISGEDEIGQLAESFERMRTSIKLAFDRLKRQRQRAADAARGY